MNELSRRRFLQRAGIAVGVGAIAPFAFVRTPATASPVALNALDTFIRRKLRASDAPGMTFSVVEGDEVVFARGYGMADIEQGIEADADTVYMLASVSKTVTCAGVMRAVEEGLLDLDDDVNDHLPFEVRIPAAPAKPITTRQLLTHTSSIRDRYSVWGTIYSPGTLYAHGDSPISLEAFLESYLAVGGSEYREGANFYDRPPGAGYSYSNIGTALAGLVAQEVTGVDFNEWCKDEILLPLGMTDSGFRLADISTSNLAMPYKLVHPSGNHEPFFQYGYPDYPDGAMRTSAAHLARWLGAFMRFGVFQGVRVLDVSTVRETRANQLGRSVSWRQGLTWYRGSSGHWGHTGGDYGVSTRMFFDARRRVGVVSLTNVSISGRRYKAFRDVERKLFEVFG